MNFIKTIIFLISIFGTSGCCISPLSFNVSIDRRTYCSFKEITGLNPSPENVRSWVSQNDGTSYRLMVTLSVLLHGMEQGLLTNKKKYAEAYLEVYSNLVSGFYGHDLKMAILSPDGRFIGIEPHRRFSVAEIAKIYHKNIRHNLENCINENRDASPYDWLSKKMKNPS